jgi:hypothetical protein
LNLKIMTNLTTRIYHLVTNKKERITTKIINISLVEKVKPSVVEPITITIN